MRLIDADALYIPPEEINVKMAVACALTIDAVPVKHGKWIHSTDAGNGYCSICNCDMPMFKEDWEWRYCETPYCPHCGADMREERA